MNKIFNADDAHITDYTDGLKPAIQLQMASKAEPKNKVSKNITEMIADLKYHNGMLQANVEAAREMQDILAEYVTRTNMTEGINELENMTDEEIDGMTIKDIGIKFPGHRLMPSDAPLINDIEGDDYGYNEEDYHKFLKDIRDRIKDYRHILDVINQACGYTNKMAETLKAARVAQAEKVINNPGATEDDKRKAHLYLRDLDIVNDCSAYFRYVIKNSDRINKCNRTTLAQKFTKYIVKHPEFEKIEELINRYIGKIAVTDDSLRPDFILVSFLSYLKYGEETLQRDIVVKRSTLSRLLNFFSGTLSDDDAALIRKSLDTMFSVIKGEEDNPWI